MARREDEVGKEPIIPPGYFQSKSATALASKLRDVSGKWKNLGIQLGLSDYSLPQEKPDRSQDYFREMLYQWLRNHPPTTRSKLLRAVTEVQPDLAMKLEPNYSNEQKLNSTHLPILMQDLHQLVPRWRQLGRKLKMEEYELNVICNPEDNEENLITVLHLWMTQKANDATLLNLYRALIDVDFKYLAEEIIKDTNVTSLLKPQGLRQRKVPTSSPTASNSVEETDFGEQPEEKTQEKVEETDFGEQPEEKTQEKGLKEPPNQKQETSDSCTTKSGSQKDASAINFKAGRKNQEYLHLNISQRVMDTFDKHPCICILVLIILAMTILVFIIALVYMYKHM